MVHSHTTPVLTRRNGLDATAAGAAAMPAPANPGRASETGPNDRRLLQMDAERRRLLDRHEELFQTWCAKDATLPADLAEGPDNRGRSSGFPLLDTSVPAVAKMCRRPGGRSSRPSLHEIRDYNRRVERMVPRGSDVWHRRRAEGRERIRHWVKRRREQLEARRLRGMPEIQAELDALNDLVERIECEIVDAPADGPQGWMVQARAMVPANHEIDEVPHVGVLTSIMGEDGLNALARDPSPA